MNFFNCFESEPQKGERLQKYVNEIRGLPIRNAGSVRLYSKMNSLYSFIEHAK